MGTLSGLVLLGGLGRAVTGAVDAPLPMDAPEPDLWTAHRGGPSQQGIARTPVADSLSLVWSFAASGPIESSPVIAEGSVWVGSADGHVYSVDLESGQRRWARDVGAPVSASPLVLGDALYVGDEDGFFHCLGAADGQSRWKIETRGKIAGAANWIPRDSTPVVVFGSYDGKLRSVDAKTGATLWEFGIENYIHGTPAVWKGSVVFGGCDGWLHVVSGDDGISQGKCRVEGQVGASAAVAAGVAYFGTYEGVMTAVDLATLKVAWIYRDRALPYVSSAAVNESLIVVGSRDRRVDCIDRTTGERLWVARTRGRVDGSPVVTGDRALVGCDDGRLYLLRLEDGGEVWSYDLGAPIRTTPAIAAGRVVVGGSDGRLHCFRGAS